MIVKLANLTISQEDDAMTWDARQGYTLYDVHAMQVINPVVLCRPYLCVEEDTI